MNVLALTQKSNPDNSGVDHLGMRVAGENAYSQLIDFTTTVTWRPRYFSFFCWATRQAFIVNGGSQDKITQKIDRKAYLNTLRRIEYAFIAATLLNDMEAPRIAGSTKVKEMLESAKKGNLTEIDLIGDHLKASNGGLNIYLGSMQNLNLLGSTNGIATPIRGSIGDRLAELFNDSIENTAYKKIFSETKFKISDLIEIGQSGSFARLSEQAKKNKKVDAELKLLRKVVINWEKFLAGNGKSANRILSIGLILEYRKLLSDEAPMLDRFREILLLGAVKVNNQILKLKLPKIYDQVCKKWCMYQSHAYATFALESFLSLALFYANEIQGSSNSNITYDSLLDDLGKLIISDTRVSKHEIPPGFVNWWELPLQKLEPYLKETVISGRQSIITEPDLHSSIISIAGEGHSIDLPNWYHYTSLMFLISVYRIKVLLEKNGKNVWIGSQQESRLPPLVLAKQLGECLKKNMNTADYLRKAIDEHVLRQHYNNALRKLIAQPKVDTTKYFLRGSNFNVVGSHKPGTSNPRFLNTIQHLQDLGYLTNTTPIVPTTEGEEILKKIRDASK